MKKKWLSELKHGEVFTTTPNPTDLSQYYIALEKFENKLYNGKRVCQQMFAERTTYLVLKNMQIYPQGLKFKNL